MKYLISSCLFIFALSFGFPAVAQNDAKSTEDGTKSTQNESARQVQFPEGKKVKVAGVIVKRNPDSFVMHDLTGGEIVVDLQGTPEVIEKKSNPFRRAKNYGTTVLLRGAVVEVVGRGNGTDVLTAEKIRMSENAVVVAQSIDSRVTPVEDRVGDAETHLAQAEANSQRMSGQ